MGLVSRVAALCLLVGGATATSAIALSSGAMAQQTFDGGVIDDIRVEGTQRIEPLTVRSYMTVRPGDRFTADKIDESLKSLFATGLFADVTLRRQAGVLVVNVVENPIINRITFEGNKREETDELYPEIQLRPRTVYTRNRVQQDVQRILEIYRRGGRFAARVEPKIIQLEQNRVDLIFEIDEGELTAVEQINFIYNNVFTDGDLREVMLTKESRWWRFLSSNDTYDPDRLAYDREQVRRHYLRNGYADYRPLAWLAELTPDQETFYITATIEEGQRYTFGKIEVKSEIEGLDGDLLRAFLPPQEGDWYDADLIEKSEEALTNLLGDLQYAFVEVEPLIQRNQETRTVDIVFELNQSPRVFVERIDIQGNVLTHDKVIRREMLLSEGDGYGTSAVKRSEQRIKDLGFFEEVEIETLAGSAADQSVLKVNVTEQATGELQLGAGYSTQDGLLANFSIRQRNLLGRGQDLSFSTLVSSRTLQADISFTEPYFLDRDLAAGIDLFRIQRDDRDTISYDLEQTGFVLRAAYPLSERLRQRLSYTLAQSKIERRFGSSLFFDTGTSTTSSIEQQLSYDARDSRLRASRGYVVFLTTEFAGIGGTERYLRNRLTASNYWNPVLDWVLSLTSEVGHIDGLGKDVRISDRFFLGGDTLRGFEPGGVGPRAFVLDAQGNRFAGDDGEALGGKAFSRGSLELKVPLGLGEALGVNFHAYLDAGTLTNSGQGQAQAGQLFLDAASVRSSAGIGVSWNSPFGPIRLDLAYPITKEEFDQTEQFRFSFGTRF